MSYLSNIPSWCHAALCFCGPNALVKMSTSCSLPVEMCTAELLLHSSNGLGKSCIILDASECNQTESRQAAPIAMNSA
ncbi:hypothetical protein CROQUDRAFT_88280 [Cronartium quercuum f. sp. fusiforme G11]|uniref:Uncharacterized protein n=1 Tax=Cronartium quercuum f. sp. fusiforme G11 TaxID=708437 RepID=A0A9P6NVI8_9BASI|nr:hypothetical protein CROQUDRAFT_88280 [Cronartium quercuum f. sp. fusiforme G11]